MDKKIRDSARRILIGEPAGDLKMHLDLKFFATKCSISTTTIFPE
jgi:hypothetical protein